jgi:hypothetical protein
MFVVSIQPPAGSWIQRRLSAPSDQSAKLGSYGDTSLASRCLTGSTYRPVSDRSSYTGRV